MALASMLACARSNPPNDSGLDAVSPDVLEETDPLAPCPVVDVSELVTCSGRYPDEILSHPSLTPSNPNYVTYLDGCEHFLGAVVYTFGDIEQLDAMQTLRVIDGGLALSMNYELLSLAGVERLEEVGRLTLRLSRPVSLEPLSQLRRVRDQFTLRSGDVVESLAGLERLECVGGLDLRSVQPWDLEVLQRLRRVEGNVNLTLPNVPREDIEAFIERLQIEGSIEVNDEIWREAGEE
jgi:hypothetical protein